MWSYRLALDSGAFEGSKVPLKFLRFVAVVLSVKAIEKGFRALKEEHLHDYNARKANIAAAEKAMWDEVSRAAAARRQRRAAAEAAWSAARVAWAAAWGEK